MIKSVSEIWFLNFEQVVAITVFCLLSVAYYAFFAPFVRGRIWEYILIGVYSPVVCTFFLNRWFLM